MIAIIINNKGIFKYNAIPAIAPPSSNEPVSPMNTCAGYILNNKNPKLVPIIIDPNIVVSFIFHIIEIMVNVAIINVVTPVDNPSIPSVKFTAFVVPNITNRAKIIYNHTGIVTNLFKNGMYMSVPFLNTVINKVM